MRAMIFALRIVLLSSWLSSSLFCQSPTQAVHSPSDPLRVDPVHYSVESETDGMLALRLKLGPDEAAPPAYFQDALIVCTSECHVRLVVTTPMSTRLRKVGAAGSEITGTGKDRHQIVDIHMEAGTTRLIGAGLRSIANLSTNPVEMLFIERKGLAADSK
jgi:hypothetical protein